MLLVHVAGTADLGIPLIVGGRSRPRQETAELTARRAAELDAARTGGPHQHLGSQLSQKLRHLLGAQRGNVSDHRVRPARDNIL